MIQVTRTFDKDAILDFLDEFLDRISEDGSDKIEVDPDDECWLQVHNSVTLDVIGMIVLVPMNRVTLDLHVHMKPEHKKFNQQAMIEVFKYFMTIGQYVKITADIPELYESVYHFALKMGFTDEGLNRLSHLKKGKLWDVHRLGITKDEIIEYIKGRGIMNQELRGVS